MSDKTDVKVAAKPINNQESKTMNDQTNVPALQQQVAHHLMEVARETPDNDLGGTILKFKKGVYYAGEDEVPLGREYVAHVTQLARGWVKFVDKKPVERIIGKVADGFKMPDRNSLDEKDKIDTQIDPWSKQAYLPVEDAETGQVAIFVASSYGGHKAVNRLCGIQAHNMHQGNPIVRLAASSYNHKEFGEVKQPDLPVVGWTNAEAPPPPKPAAKDELSDDIPF